MVCCILNTNRRDAVVGWRELNLELDVMKRKKKSKNNSVILRILILVVCGYFCVTLAGLWSSLNESLKELKTLEEQYLQEKNNISELRAMLDSDSDTLLIEKAARERLGYIYSDEQVFIDISGN